MENLYGSEPFSYGTTQGDDVLSDYELLKRSLLNERASPEILPFQAEVVENIYHFFEHQEEVIRQTESASEYELRNAILSVEITRAKYMLRSYLRTRILKIEKYGMHCLDNDEIVERLSEQELHYAKGYVKLMANHLNETVAQKLPEAFNDIWRQSSANVTKDMLPAPDLGRHVFARILKDLGSVQVYDDGSTADLEKGDLYILRYNMLRQFLDEGAVQLC